MRMRKHLGDGSYTRIAYSNRVVVPPVLRFWSNFRRYDRSMSDVTNICIRARANRFPSLFRIFVVSVLKMNKYWMKVFLVHVYINRFHVHAYPYNKITNLLTPILKVFCMYM